MEKRKQEFEEMAKFKLLGEDETMINDFLEYWTESSYKGKKMRFEKEPVFDINRRFKTWKTNSIRFAPKEPISKIDAGLKSHEEALRILNGTK